jgi:FkbM family methyltransferase
MPVRLEKTLISLARVLIVLIVVVTAAYFYHPVRMFALVKTGRVSACSVEQAMQSAGNLRLRKDAHSRVSKTSRVVEADTAGFHLWETPRGRFWAPKRQNLPWLIAELELKHIEPGEHLSLSSGDIVLDCGANVGVFTREALAAGAKLVVAVEPSPRNIVCLRRNFKDDIDGGRVIIYEKGVWDKEDLLTLHEGTSAAEDSVVLPRNSSRQEVKVPLTTIDKMVAELRLEGVDYIKMDIEGAEQRALVGAQQTLAQYKPQLEISVNHLPNDAEKVPELVRKAWSGYRTVGGPCLLDGLRIRPEVMHFH